MKPNVVEENSNRPHTISDEKPQDQEAGEETAQTENDDNQGDIQADTKDTSTPVVEDLELETAYPQIEPTAASTSIEPTGKEADTTQTGLDKTADTVNGTGEAIKGQSAEVNTGEDGGVGEMKVESVQSVEFNTEKEEQRSVSNVQADSGVNEPNKEKSNGGQSEIATFNRDQVPDSHVPLKYTTAPLKPLPDLNSTLVVVRSEPRLPLLPAKHPLVLDESLKSQSAVILGTGPERLASITKTSSEPDTDRKNDASKPKRMTRASSGKGSLKSSSLKERAKSRESLRSANLKSRSETKFSSKGSTKSTENIAKVGSSSKLSVSRESLKVASQVYGSAMIKKTSSNSSVMKESGQLSSKSRDSLKASVTELPPNKTEGEKKKGREENGAALDVASSQSQVDNNVSPSLEKVEVTPEGESSNDQTDKDAAMKSEILHKPDDSVTSVGRPVTVEEENKNDESSTAQNNTNTSSQIIDVSKTKSSSSLESAKHENELNGTPSRSQEHQLDVSKTILDSKKVEVDHHTGQPSSEESIKAGRNVAPDSKHAGNEKQAPIVQEVVAAL